MTGTNVACDTQAKRCAVCKIDLKGRFVYVDDATERLTGYTKEELFGKSFLDMVTENDQPVVKHVLYQRSHYESFYDSVRIEIIGRNKSPRPAAAIFSLNFIAGNPVNFQVIIDVDTRIEVQPTEGTVDYTLRDFMHELLVLPRDKFNPELPKILSEYFCASRPVIYQYHPAQSDLEPLTASTSTKAGGQPIVDGAEPKAMMLRIAETGEEYCCDDSASIQKAIEQLGFAPHEYIARLQTDTHHTYILRLRFEEKLDADKLHDRVGDARQIIEIVERLSPNETAGSASGTDPDGKGSSDRRAHGRRTLQEAQLALTSTMQLLSRLDKFLRD